MKNFVVLNEALYAFHMFAKLYRQIDVKQRDVYEVLKSTGQPTTVKEFYDLVYMLQIATDEKLPSITMPPQHFFAHICNICIADFPYQSDVRKVLSFTYVPNTTPSHEVSLVIQGTETEETLRTLLTEKAFRNHAHLLNLARPDKIEW